MHEVLAIAYVLAGNLRKAEKEFRTALKLVPSNKRAAHELAEVLYRLGDNSEAINVLHASLARDPADPEAREILARTYEKDAAFKQARQELLEAAPFIDESNTEQRGRVFNNIGVCTSLLDRTHLAAQWFAKSIDSAPSASAVPYLNAARE